MGETGLEFKDVLTMYFERATAAETFWNFYLSISLGYLAFLAAAEKSRLTPVVLSLLAIGFVVFAYVNLDALSGVEKQRLELQRLLLAEPRGLKRNSYPQEADLVCIRGILNASPLAGVRELHITGDVLLLLAIFAIPWSRKRMQTVSHIASAEKSPINPPL